MESKFPELWEGFIDGCFVFHQSLQRGSGIPMDQTLEKQYNKLTKSSSGVIGFTRRKEAVCRWNIIKHEKHQCSEVLSKICHYNPEDAYIVYITGLHLQKLKLINQVFKEW